MSLALFPSRVCLSALLISSLLCCWLLPCSLAKEQDHLPQAGNIIEGCWPDSEPHLLLQAVRRRGPNPGPPAKYLSNPGSRVCGVSTVILPASESEQRDVDHACSSSEDTLEHASCERAAVPRGVASASPLACAFRPVLELKVLGIILTSPAFRVQSPWVCSPPKRRIRASSAVSVGA